MKILWVKSDFLHPTNRGGQIRTLEILKRLHAKHEVHYVAYASSADTEGVRRANEYCSYAYPVIREIKPRASLGFALDFVGNLFSSMPLALSRYCSEGMRQKIREITATHHFDSVVCDFLMPGPNFDDVSRCVVFQHNVETMIWRRHADAAADPLRKAYFRNQASRMEAWERRICRDAAHVLAVSPQDRDLLRDMFGITNVSVVATGVDTDYFRNPGGAPGRSDLVFVGSMDWMPNIDGVDYFVREMLPLIRQQQPDCSLAIVGRSPSASTKALAARDPQIQLTGTVPDIRPWLWGASVSIVPLRIGGGTRLKIYESMAADVPVVSTTIGAEGLDVSHPDNIRIADTPSEFAEQCVRLLSNADERRAVAAAALDLVDRHFSWEIVSRDFEECLIRARDGRHAPSAAAR